MRVQQDRTNSAFPRKKETVSVITGDGKLVENRHLARAQRTQPFHLKPRAT